MCLYCYLFKDTSTPDFLFCIHCASNVVSVKKKKLDHIYFVRMCFPLGGSWKLFIKNKLQ